MHLGRFLADDQVRIGHFSEADVVNITHQVKSFGNALSNPRGIDTSALKRFATKEIEYLPPPPQPGRTLPSVRPTITKLMPPNRTRTSQNGP